MTRPVHSALTALVLTVVPVGGGAQSVVGTVVEDETLRPLAGAFVVLEDGAGGRAAAGLAAEDGRFMLRAPAPGEYRLVAQLIGYADATTGFFALGEGETVRRSVQVSVRAVNLEGIRAEVGRRCHERPGSGPQTARLWEEARKALEIIDWTESEAALRFRIVEHVRELDARSLRVSSIREQARGGWYSESPYRSVPIDELDTEGYIQPAPGGQWDHFGPDAEVLLSQPFLATHCFRVAEAGEPDLVGLAFEPVRGRTHPEIEGVIWVDRGTAELRRVDFTYVNAPYPYGEWDQVGGRVEFERLSTGMWVVRRWYVRMPLEVRRIGGYRGEPTEMTLVSLREEGAEVTEVYTGSGEALARATGATLYGVVEDSMTGHPLEGATVEVLPTGLRTRTGGGGAYRLSGLPTGTFDVRVAHPDLELLGGEPVHREVHLGAGRATRLAVNASLAELAVARCREAGEFTDPVVLYGHVRDRDDRTAVPSALVRVFTDLGEERVVSDNTGGYAVCLERDDSVAVAAVGAPDVFLDAHSLELGAVDLGTGVVARRDLHLAPNMVAVLPQSGSGDPLVRYRISHSGSRWSNAIHGTVVRHADGAPVPGAMVLVRRVDDGRPLHSSVTNQDGRFRFIHPDRNTEEVELIVEHVAYGRISEVVGFRAEEQIHLEVVLTEHPVDIAPIVVTERRRGFLADMGFYDRVDRGAGLVIQREEIERRVPGRITDLMQGRSGWRVMRTPDGKQDIRITGPVRLQGECQPAIWVDGALARAGGEPRKSGTVTGGTLFVQPQLSEIVSPEEVEAIELYNGAAGMPMQYGGSNASCGVVLIWTRRGGA